MTDGQKDMAKLTVALLNFTNALKNSPDGEKFDCTKSERETIGNTDVWSWREMAQNKKQTRPAA